MTTAIVPPPPSDEAIRDPRTSSTTTIPHTQTSKAKLTLTHPSEEEGRIPAPSDRGQVSWLCLRAGQQHRVPGLLGVPGGVTDGALIGDPIVLLGTSMPMLWHLEGCDWEE